MTNIEALSSAVNAKKPRPRLPIPKAYQSGKRDARTTLIVAIISIAANVAMAFYLWPKIM